MNDKPLTNATTFQECFTKSAPYPTGSYKPGSSKGYTRKSNEFTNPVGGYCQVTRVTPEGSKYVPALLALPSDLVFDAVCQHMLLIDYDQINFELIIFDNGNARVYAHYNQIIGSRLIAVIDSSTIPVRGA